MSTKGLTRYRGSNDKITRLQDLNSRSGRTIGLVLNYWPVASEVG